MNVTGKLLINGEWVGGGAGSFQAVNPATGETLSQRFGIASTDQVYQACAAAEAASTACRVMAIEKRAAFLRACAEQIMALGDVLVDRVMAETGLPRARIEAERGRTCGQLNMFAETVEVGSFLDARIDTALPDRLPMPRPDLRSMMQAVGPVVVFGASNFPLAFSVAGGDTASAFAAGCPVLAKGHPSHPGSCELVAQAIFQAADSIGMPRGVFSLLSDSGHAVGRALVTAPEVKAVGFTGTFSGGAAIAALAAQRPVPIPVFAEMGSLNPVVLLPRALEEDAEKLAVDFVGSLTLGVGQFCTNPGLVVGIESAALNRFVETVRKELSAVPAGVMLNEGIQRAYVEGTDNLGAQPGVIEAAAGKYQEERKGFCGQAFLFTVSAEDFIANQALSAETFGPASLLVRCRDKKELQSVIENLEGQLTGTIHTAIDEMDAYVELIDTLTQRVGRLLVNGFPTGVEVCHAMVHGGPFPATSDMRFTSVGTASIQRFLRPVCLQNYPERLLPLPLQDHNPLGVWRLVNGVRTKESILKFT